MATVHSRKTRAYLDDIALACHVRQVGIDHQVAMIDITTLCDDSYAYVEGDEGGSFSFGGLVDTDASAVFTPVSAMRQAGDQPVSVAPAGYALGNQVWIAEAKLSQLGHEARTRQAVAFTLGMMTEGRPDLGVSLHDVLAAETSADSETSHDGAASSANGGAGILHCSAFTGTDITVKVQHSANNSTWADLLTFTQLTATGSEHAEVAASTTVNRYLRATWTGTFDSATFAVAFARR